MNVRPSNTEPLLRLNLEALSRKDMERKRDEVLATDPRMTTTPEEAFEQAALAGVHRLAVPTPFAVGKVNAYLIEDDPLTLIDGGPNYGSGARRPQRVDSPPTATRSRTSASSSSPTTTPTTWGWREIVVEHSGAEVGGARHRRGAARQLRHRSANSTTSSPVELMLRSGISEEHRARPAERLQLVSAAGAAAVNVTRPLADGEVVELARPPARSPVPARPQRHGHRLLGRRAPVRLRRRPPPPPHLLEPADQPSPRRLPRAHPLADRLPRLDGEDPRTARGQPPLRRPRRAGRPITAP